MWLVERQEGKRAVHCYRKIFGRMCSRLFAYCLQLGELNVCLRYQRRADLAEKQREKVLEGWLIAINRAKHHKEVARLVAYFGGYVLIIFVSGLSGC